MNLSSISSTLSKSKAFLDAGLSLVYPGICQVCKEKQASAQEGFVCSQCWTQVRFIRPPFCERCGLPFEGDLTTPFECANCRDVKLYFSSARSAVVAKNVVLEVIHRYKYQHALWFEPFLTDLFLREAKPALATATWDLIVPVPLHSAKEREREFNQAARLARCLGSSTKIPVNEGLLSRVTPTRTQTQLTKTERAENVRKAFTMRNGQRLDGKRIVLVDDVFTTGATTNACARVLRKAGTSEVCVWTVARGL
jgi:competence protein ComFC